MNGLYFNGCDTCPHPARCKTFGCSLDGKDKSVDNQPNVADLPKREIPMSRNNPLGTPNEVPEKLKGWQCPRCEAIYAPHIHRCQSC